MFSDKRIDDIRKAQFDFSGKNGWIALFTNPYFFARKNLYDSISFFSPAMKGRILDFGCGAKPYQMCFNKCTEYVGCDIEISGHDHNNEAIDVFYDGKTLPFGDESFDSIFSSEVFEHVDNLEDMIPELARVIKRGGYMLVTVPFLWNEHEQPYDFRRFTSYGISKVLRENGFIIIDQKKCTTGVEALTQFFIAFLRGRVTKRTHNRTVIIVFQRLIITPIIVLGIIISLLTNKDETWYTDNVILCKKEKETR